MIGGFVVGRRDFEVNLSASIIVGDQIHYQSD